MILLTFGLHVANGDDTDFREGRAVLLAPPGNTRGKGCVMSGEDFLSLRIAAEALLGMDTPDASPSSVIQDMWDIKTDEHSR